MKNDVFKTILFSVGQLLVALVAEAVMRRMGHGNEADAAEGAAINAMVNLCNQIIDSMTHLPDWIRQALKNPVMLATFARWVDDQVELGLNKGMDELNVLKPNPNI